MKLETLRDHAITLLGLDQKADEVEIQSLDSLIAKPPVSSFRTLARIIMLLLGLFFIWASFASLQEVAVAEGEVVPEEQIQSIQHLEGGIIEKINAQEGDHVKAGQELIQLNVSAFVANKEEMKINLETLLLKKYRLTVESKGGQELPLPDEMKDFRESLIRGEQQVFEGRRVELESRIKLLEEQMSQRELDVKQLEAERASILKNLGLLREKLKISTDLVKDQLTSQLDHLQLKGEVEELEGRYEIVQVSIPRAQKALAEAVERQRNEQLVFQNNALNELNTVEGEIARTQELLGRATDQVSRTTVTSPIDGIVKSLKTHTLGGVVQPGEVIMEIVPISQKLLIEAKLNPKDIGFVKVGQKALVKFQTYDYARYGGLEGDVISLSADSHIDRATNASYFVVKVRTDSNNLGGADNSLPISPGMMATIEIHTGKKSVMEYLLKPLIKVGSESFRER